MSIYFPRISSAYPTDLNVCRQCIIPYIFYLKSICIERYMYNKRSFQKESKNIFAKMFFTVAAENSNFPEKAILHYLVWNELRGIYCSLVFLISRLTSPISKKR